MGEFRKVVVVVAILGAVAGEVRGAVANVPANVIVAADGSGDFADV